jgi:hypothetical protein
MLFNPRLRVAFGLVRLAHPCAVQLRVFNLFNLLITHLRQPALESLRLGQQDGLDDAKQGFGVGATGLLRAACSLNTRGQIAPTFGKLRVTAAKVFLRCLLDAQNQSARRLRQQWQTNTPALLHHYCIITIKLIAACAQIY